MDFQKNVFSGGMLQSASPANGFQQKIIKKREENIEKQ